MYLYSGGLEFTRVQQESEQIRFNLVGAHCIEMGQPYHDCRHSNDLVDLCRCYSQHRVAHRCCGLVKS